MSFFATAMDDGTYALTGAGFTALVLLLVVFLLVGCAVFGQSKKFSAKQLAFSAMALALATGNF